MRFAVLGSGSRGNAMVVQQGRTTVMVDCGFSLRETERRLARLGLAIEQLSALLVTHEHGDHASGVTLLARRHRLPVWATHGTAAGLPDRELAELHELCSHQDFVIDDLHIHPFPVPHDAREPSQFVFSNGRVRLGLLTDLGCSTPHVESQISGCDALLLECNHDAQRLASGNYPPSLKRRVGGRHGHLNNQQSATLLGNIDSSRLQHIVAAHLSEKHNTPQLARQALAGALGCSDDWVAVADQTEGLAWRGLE